MFRHSAKIIVEDATAPFVAYTACIIMEDLLEKLKLLNYDTEFLQELNMKDINRHYFAIPTNPGEQFYMFTSLAAWLMKKNGRNLELPQESDDPNSTISGILEYLREIDVPIEFPPNKLKKGVGEHVVYVLDNLANLGLTASSFKWKKIFIPYEDPTPEPGIEDDDAELILEKVDEDILPAYEEEEEDIVHVDDITKLYGENLDDNNKPDRILQSNTDAEEWKLELERVLQQLKVTVRTDFRDWRSHLEQMKKLQTAIERNLSGTQGQLEKLQSDIRNTLDKISTRENYLNQELEFYLNDHKSLQEDFSKIKEQYRDVSGGVTERIRMLHKLSGDLDKINRELDERGSSMTDGIPLINLKKSITKMKSEISVMNIRIGVLEYSLMCSKIRDRTQLQDDMNITSDTNNSSLIS